MVRGTRTTKGHTSSRRDRKDKGRRTDWRQWAQWPEERRSQANITEGDEWTKWTSMEAKPPPWRLSLLSRLEGAHGACSVESSRVVRRDFSALPKAVYNERSEQQGNMETSNSCRGTRQLLLVDQARRARSTEGSRWAPGGGSSRTHRLVEWRECWMRWRMNRMRHDRNETSLCAYRPASLARTRDLSKLQLSNLDSRDFTSF